MATKTTIHDVIESFQYSTNVAKGTKFEELMVQYFQLDPTLASEYDIVKRWPEWDHNEHTHDVGIDLVARNKLSGEWTAVQCKFYAPTHTLQKADIDSFFTASGKAWDNVTFTNRIIISTTDKWSKHATDALKNQAIPVQRIGLPEIAAAPVDWMWDSKLDLEVDLKKAVRYGLRPHQKEALHAIHQGFETHDRGQWISACGTGKTFTSLKLAEQMASQNGGALKVLFLAPSIALVSQTLREWLAQSQTTIRPLVVCSDTKASKAAEDISTFDIPLPTTDADRLVAEMAGIGRRGRQMTVVFSTYQSIDVVAQAMQKTGEHFDLILCDEAHRTTGVQLAGDPHESAFTKVHDNEYLPATKRLYMTATPRIYGEAVKAKADEASALLTSMDDEKTYGPEFHRLGFGEAVERKLLTDYKVMILVVEGDAVATRLQATLANDDNELALDDAAKIVGCWNGLAKRTHDGDFGPHPEPMKRAVAFCQDIKSSQAFADAFPRVVETLAHEDGGPVCEVAHVDGTMNAMIRGEKITWLKSIVPDGECRVLSNARCLSEGVDVPALDAVMFLHPRNSLVDVVQSVGRVMRKAPGKDFGYVILPVATPAGMAPEEALKDNKRFKVVWDVLNALRSHDERFSAMINAIDLDKKPGDTISIDIIGNRGATDTEDGSLKPRPVTDLQLPLFGIDQWKDAILARIVKKVGDREYWDQWASDVVDINANQTARINTILDAGDAGVAARFEEFLAGLRANLNDSITRADAVSMLSQHLITRPVFEALFEHESFVSGNPVAQSMQIMVAALQERGLDAETVKLEGFYDSVRRRASQVMTPEGSQTVVHELYEQFFKLAFPKQASSLGVVYTPVEIVDFILRMADDVSRQEFGRGLSDEGVHILDPFTGTGTFIVRLLQSGIIRPEDLARKYASELWANEIMLLAYYIACVNIETTYQALRVEQTGEDVPYEAFPGATLTDTFQITETSDRADSSLIPANNDRIEKQLATPIHVIVGNPPYSAGQSSANDNNANLKYPTLDARIADTYAKRSTATNKNSLYDSYIRAFRWAADRIGDAGIIAFVSNNGWVDGNTADGIRLTFADEFSDVWVYNLRGNQRTAGETSRQEGGKVFGSGARTGVAVLVAAKRPDAEHPCRIHYHGVPDYQTREEKLAGVDNASLSTAGWTPVTPNAEGDWLNQRNDCFGTFTAIGSKGGSEPAIFALHSSGLKTNRDAWCYNFSRDKLERAMASLVDAYNATVDQGPTSSSELDRDPTRISWSGNLETDAIRGRRHSFKPERVYTSLYRPFTREVAYFDRSLNERVYRLENIYPTPHHENLGMYVDAGAGEFTPIALTCLPDLHVSGSNSNGQVFPRWTYEKASDEGQGSLLEASSDVDEWGYRRVDNVTDEILSAYQEKFGPQATKDDIFFYVYGVLHSQQYRTTFAADLKRMLPRIPFAASTADFEAFAEAGRRLSDLHANYETVEPYPLHEQALAFGDPWDVFHVTKMAWVDKKTKSAIRVNKQVILGDIPAEAHRYMLGSRSALEWIIDRYQIKTDKASGIVNDPNDWGREHDDPRYIVDLIKRVTRVSVETMKIVDSLPRLPLDTPSKEQ